jgi:hypothetical protein
MRITKQMLVEMFERSISDPKCKWDIRGECLWGYFFTDEDEERLVGAGRELERRGYRLVGLLHPDPEDDADESPSVFLHVERIETHTPETLHELNEQLYAFADEWGLESYDGMDVGPVDGPRQPPN